VNLEYLRNIMYIFDKDAGLNEPFKKIISTYNIADSIKSGKFKKEKLYDEILNSEEFSNFITGKNLKELLFFNDSLDSKRLHLEEYIKVKNNFKI
jgi:hypothetical protein